MAGDSTMASYNPDRYPLTGWGQVVPDYINEIVQINNFAKSGRSTKSFINEGHWRLLYDSLCEGDYVFIQFGHNDEKQYDSARYAAPNTSFRNNLVKFVEDSRSKGAIPVLFTPIARRQYDGMGSVKDTHGAYTAVTISVADSMGVTCVDMNKLTMDYLSKSGREESKKIYCWVEASENYPDGKQDNTHLSEHGAQLFATMALEELARKDAHIAEYIDVEK